MAFIYNLTDTWNDVTTTWNGIKLAVTNTGADSSSKLLNLTVTGASTASFVVDKSGNLALNGTVNKITFTAPATGAILTLADNSTFITSGAYSSTFTFTGATTLTFPTSGTVTALGNTTTGSGSIVLATSPTLVTPALGTPSSVTLTNATGLPISTGLTGTGTGVLTALAVNVGSAGSFVTFNGALGTPSSGNLSNCTGYPAGGITGLGTGVATALAINVGSAGSIVTNGGALGTPSSGTLTNATGLPLTTGVTGTLPVANGGTGITSFGTGVATALGVNVGSAGAFVVNGGALGTPSSGTLTNATGLPISTGVSGLGTGVATFLATPSSANLASAVTDETGSGPLVFATSPTFTSQVTLGTQGTTQGSLVLSNTASTYATTIKSSNSATAAYTLTLPTTAGTNGYFLQTDGVGNLTWAAGGGGGGGGTPGGSNTNIQYNNAGAFGGSAAFTFDGTSIVGIGTASTTTGTLKLFNSASANAVSLKSGNNGSAWTMTLPTSGGSANYFLQTDGSGNTTWAAAAAGTINAGTVGQITYYSGTSTLSGTTTGTGVLTALGNNTNVAGGIVVPSSALTANAIVIGGGSGTGPSTTTTGTGVLTAIGNATNGASGLAVLNGSGYLDVAQGGTGLGSLTAGYIPFGNGTSAFGSASNLSWDNTNKLLTVTGLGTGGSTATGGLTVSGGSFGLSGNISANAWTTSGIRYKNASATLTDLTSTGTVAAAYTNVFGGNTIAASNATTYTDYFTTYISEPTAGTNVTFTNKWAFGITGNAKFTGSLTLGTALTVANGGTGLTSGTSGGVLYFSASGTMASSSALTANALVIGGGAGVAPSTTSTAAGILTFLGTPSSANLAAAVTDETGSGLLVFATSPTLTTPRLAGSSTGYTSFASANSSASNYTVTFPAETMTVGFRNIPAVGTKTSSYTLAVGDVGKYVQVGTSGSITIPDATFAEGDVISIFNNTTGNITITCSITTAYIAGINTAKASVTLATRGVATILFISGTVCVISGSVS